MLSFAEAARIYDYRQPTMTEENVIDIVQGRLYNHLIYWPYAHFNEQPSWPTRHPLQELVVDTFVANDAYVVGGLGQSEIAHSKFEKADNDAKSTLRQDCNSVVVCTGANACGKVSENLRAPICDG